MPNELRGYRRIVDCMDHRSCAWIRYQPKAGVAAAPTIVHSRRKKRPWLVVATLLLAADIAVRLLALLQFA